MAFRKGTSENTILFFEGGHNHDGVSSALIDVDEYSIYDFIVGKTGSSTRQATQQRNFDNLKTVICNIVTTDILGPAGVRLAPNSVQSVHIAAGSITTSELAANIVLVNNVISSGNYSTGVAGWSINSNGSAEFDIAVIRGQIQANSIYINNLNYWNSNGTFSVGAANNIMFFNGTNLELTGTVTATAGQIAGWQISGDSLVTGGNFSGDMVLGKFANSNYAGMRVSGAADGGGYYPEVTITQGVINLTVTNGSAVTSNTTYTSKGVIYNNLDASNSWQFFLSGGDVYARVTTGGSYVDYCLQQCGNSPTTTTTAATTAATTTAATTTAATTTAAPGGGGGPPEEQGSTTTAATTTAATTTAATTTAAPSCSPPCPQDFICVNTNLCIG